AVGEWLNYIIFGLMGIFGYLFPFLLFFGVAFGIANRKNRIATRKIVCVLVFLVCVGSLLELVNGYDPELKWTGYFTASAEGKSGGGILGGTPVRLLCPLFDTVATIVILFAVMLVCLMLLTGRELFAYIGRRTRDTVREHRSSAAERAERRLAQEAEEFEDDEFSTRRARIITFQKGTAEAAQEPAEERDVAAAGQLEKKSAAEEPIRFLHALKARGRKNGPAKQAQEQAEETSQSPVAVEIEEVTPEAAMVNITISGSYEKEEKSFYEEELKRKFGEQQTDSAFAEYRGEKPGRQNQPDQPEETEERGHERAFYDVNVAEGTGVPLLVRTKWPDIVSIIEKKRREQQASGNTAATGQEAVAEGASEPESVSKEDSFALETEAGGLGSGQEPIAAGGASEPEFGSGAESLDGEK
ncbi:MAG: DNA translocase FtsK 4TM domain-containing protein, partial [Lachnospiraceae bacterium]|nr:DNA translocase FtsK 4TM domain-containing protein [Lachnospiraceae bacterium]